MSREPKTQIIESATNAESLNTHEKRLIETMATLERQALTKRQSAAHILYVGSNAAHTLDVFAQIRFFTEDATFATLEDGRDLPGFTHIDNVDLSSMSLMLKVSLEGYGKGIVKMRDNEETVTRIGVSAMHIPVKIVYDKDKKRFELVSIGKRIYRYSQKRGFYELDESVIGKNLPGMDSAALIAAIERKIRSYVVNNTNKCDQRDKERNDKVTLYGEYKSQS